MSAVSVSEPGVRPILAEAVDVARRALLELQPEGVGEHLGVTAEDEYAATHHFATTLPGYRGWQWAVVVAAPPEADRATVSESALLPGPDALVAPDFIPWDQRVRPGDLAPGDLLAPLPDDPRLVPGYLVTGDPVVDDVCEELGQGRAQVLSREGREEAAERWFTEYGPDTDMARAAPSTCRLCGFYVPLAGAMRASYGVCANALGADGHVVHAEYGCGAHSDTELPTGGGSPVYEAYDDAAVELVSPEELRKPSAVAAGDVVEQDASASVEAELAPTSEVVQEDAAASADVVEQASAVTTSDPAPEASARVAESEDVSSANAVEAGPAENVAVAAETTVAETAESAYTAVNFDSAETVVATEGAAGAAASEDAAGVAASEAADVEAARGEADAAVAAGVADAANSEVVSSSPPVESEGLSVSDALATGSDTEQISTAGSSEQTGATSSESADVPPSTISDAATSAVVETADESRTAPADRPWATTDTPASTNLVAAEEESAPASAPTVSVDRPADSANAGLPTAEDSAPAAPERSAASTGAVDELPTGSADTAVSGSGATAETFVSTAEPSGPAATVAAESATMPTSGAESSTGSVSGSGESAEKLASSAEPSGPAASAESSTTPTSAGEPSTRSASGPGEPTSAVEAFAQAGEPVQHAVASSAEVTGATAESFEEPLAEDASGFGASSTPAETPAAAGHRFGESAPGAELSSTTGDSAGSADVAAPSFGASASAVRESADSTTATGSVDSDASVDSGVAEGASGDPASGGTEYHDAWAVSAVRVRHDADGASGAAESS